MFKMTKLNPGEVTEAYKTFVAWDVEKLEPRLVPKGEVVVVSHFKTHHKNTGDFLEVIFWILAAGGPSFKCRVIDYPETIFKLFRPRKVQKN